jgi:hypothetical protein
MDAFHRFAVFTLLRDACFVALAAGTLMVGFSFAPALALAIGADIALLFAVALLLRVACLTAEGVVATEAWRILRPEERPVGSDGRRLARDALRAVLLRFAKAAAAVAIVLYSSSLTMSLGSASRSLRAVVTQSLG